MGIHKFFYYFKNKYAENIHVISHDQTIPEFFKEDNDTESKLVDNLLIDFNSQIHQATQKVFEYGAGKAPLLPVRRPRLSFAEKQEKVFEEIASSLEKLIKMVSPNKRVLIFIDGVAPQCKQNQQKKRRFVSAKERMENKEAGNGEGFDPSSISPGTKFLDFVSRFLDFYIKKQMSTDPNWKNLEVIFSNEKVVGEGEWKLMNWLRKNKKDNETYCVCGMDADLIMLTLASDVKDIFLLREEPQDKFYGYYFIFIDEIRKQLSSEMDWTKLSEGEEKEERKEKGKKEKKFLKKNAMLDFLFICYTIGNDFLPKMETVDVILGSIELMLELYTKNGLKKGHLIKKGKMDVKSVSSFFDLVSKYEKDVLVDKIKQRHKFFPDPLLISHGIYDKNKNTIDFSIKTYRKKYLEVKLGIKGEEKEVEEKTKKLVFEYLTGMQFVLDYYTGRKGENVPSWSWKYPYHYAPFPFHVAKYAKEYVEVEHEQGEPHSPFLQLLSILPEASSHLLPKPLNTLMKSDSELGEYFPEYFHIDLAGKSKEYEGVVLLPILSHDKLEEAYFSLLDQVNEKDLRRNVAGKTFVYTQGDRKYHYENYRGSFTCTVNVKLE